MNIIFVITFLFSVVRFISWIKLFELQVNSPIAALFGINKVTSVLDILLFWFGWFYQIWFWFSFWGVI